jgi:hypothetical protein
VVPRTVINSRRSPAATLHNPEADAGVIVLDQDHSAAG